MAEGRWILLRCGCVCVRADRSHLCIFVVRTTLFSGSDARDLSAMLALCLLSACSLAAALLRTCTLTRLIFAGREIETEHAAAAARRVLVA